MLDFYGEKYDRLLDDKERARVTAVSRTTAYELELLGRYPVRRKLGVGNKKCGWLLSELLHWIHNQPYAQ
ncbi:helix-turn-helix transcriptional regulator [Rouxiella badensis]|uniref:helix-turn-helix transcriptional regulator n=1 Tax=Rouxiella badensis TaxID=1646377 RepID=UPI003C6A4F3C